MKTKVLIVLALLTLVFGAQTALADCFVGGTITACYNPDPDGPLWMYTVVVTWDTGTDHSLNYINILLDYDDGTCGCTDFRRALSWDDPCGSSDGYLMDCVVHYQSNLVCQGDPVIPEMDGILMKFQPIEDDCIPGPSGTGTMYFYSDLGPCPVDEELLSIVDRYEDGYCLGSLSGDFPCMDCDPVPNEDTNWGNVKGLFR
jgi:hypothetical protein